MSVAPEDDATLPGDDSAPQGSGRRTPERWLMPGAPVGRYMVLSRLGAGGMGVVYAAYDPELDRKVALKLLRPGSSALHHMREREHGMLKQEAQALAKLSHPNVIAVHDVGEHDGGVFLAMEFVDGDTLGRWLEDEHDWREILERFLRAGEGLRAAHEQGLVHRDFKPDNVMVGRDGRVRVMDFGLARSAALLDGGEATGLAGTPAYMAPEQHAGVGVDARSDQFSFCVALWEGLFGARPFDGETVPELMSNIEAGHLRAPERRSAVPGWVRKAVLQGLEADPARRHASMEALVQALRRDPTRARRRWVGAAAVVVLAGGALGGRAWIEARDRQACASAGRVIEDAWTPDARAAVEQAMLRHQVAFAQETWDLVAPRLDGYAASWQHAREAACTASRLEARWSEAVATSAVECLEERRAAFEALVELLAGAELEQLATATAAAAELPPIDACLDEAALARRPPARLEERDRALHVRTEAMRGEVEWKAGRRAEGEARLEAAAATAQALGDAELVALMDGKLADVRLGQGRYDDAIALLRGAYFGYGRLGMAEAQVSLAATLARTEAEYRSHPDLAESWLDHARMLHQHTAGLDAPEPLLVTRAHATLLAQRGDYEAAAELARRAWERGVEILGPDHPSVDSLVSTVADIETRRGSYDVALQLTRDGLDRVRRVRGDHHPEVGRTLINLALLQSHRGELEAALAHAREAVALTEQSLGPEHPHTLAAERELITLQLKRGEHDQALARIERVLAVYDRRGPGEGIEMRALLGGLLTQYDEHARAIAVLQAALEGLRARHGSDHPDALGLLINLGAAHRGLGDDEAAARAYREALRVGEATLAPDHPMLAFPLNNLGNVERERGNLEEARRMLVRALEIRRAKLSPTHPLVASTLDALAEVDLDEHRPQDAIERLEQAQEILANGADPKRQAIVALHLGRALLEADREQERARALLAEAERTFDTLGLETRRAEAERMLASLGAEVEPRRP